MQFNLAAGQVAVGDAPSTGANIVVSTGFQPAYVEVVNVTTRGGMQHFHGMAAATGLKTVAAGTRTLAAANGITVGERGFTIGADADVNPAGGDVLRFIAIG